MRVVTTSAELAGAEISGCALVPTMGALHEGHASLVRLAREHAGSGPVVVSVFVNPTQFNERTDFDRYPRVLEEDCRWCEELGVDVVFAPAVEVVYPEGEDVPVGPLPAVATRPKLEDAYRPGHFEGVCQVVRRLFVLTGAATGVFGAKDWQQLQVVRAMSEEEGLGVKIVPGETVREADGLAMSSRNRLLDDEARARAVVISRAIREAGGLGSPGQAEALMAEMIRGAGLELEYAAVRDAATLGAPAPGGPCRSLVAARVGGVRLIDNGPWPTPA